ncbi:energy-coupling factor transporter transmembrane component T family protein [Leucobacter massiliensis]|uniref:Cobalt transport protein n=1 Tax=Leucobacter massiliensis TaxID=1686285 RepID=A0A2S9QS30_9MICO|nr:energy-coupling factor transporter transmembrane component T [Leucobacter massiliensis]PRI12395.1 cobalt transport protein [Leucobacter massiliensis]
MSAPSPLGAYRPGTGPLHRAAPGVKLLGLFTLAIAVVWTRGAAFTALWLGIAVALALLAGLRGRDFWRVTRGFALVAVPLFAFQAWQQGWERGFEVVGDLFALILAASALTASTSVDDMLDTVAGALGPLRRFGVRPERVALAFSLVIRAIPSTLEIARETQAAARARGLERSPRARAVPLVLRTVAHAQATGEALAARGVGEE